LARDLALLVGGTAQGQTSKDVGCGERREAEPDQDGAGYRNRCAEARSALKKRAERKRNEKKLQPTVVGDATDRVLQSLEHAFFHRQAIKEDDVKDDPNDREKAGYRAEHGCGQ
jgi:hypothetical protein